MLFTILIPLVASCMLGMTVPYPPDERNPLLQVLTAGIFHDDEVWAGADKQAWVGLFRGKSGYYLASTKISTERVHDEIVDDLPDQKTGWKVTTSVPDESLLLISGQSGIKQGRVIHWKFPREKVYPGDTMRFEYGGAQYTVYATGRKRGLPEEGGVEVSDYHLFLRMNRGGVSRTQLLVHQPTFDDQMIRLLFAGDLDGDRIPDLILDTSDHYNLQRPTLYLSAPAKGKDFLVPAGWHEQVGC